MKKVVGILTNRVVNRVSHLVTGGAVASAVVDETAVANAIAVLVTAAISIVSEWLRGREKP
jgi:hypothetical protein